MNDKEEREIKHMKLENDQLKNIKVVQMRLRIL